MKYLNALTQKLKFPMGNAWEKPFRYTQIYYSGGVNYSNSLEIKLKLYACFIMRRNHWLQKSGEIQWKVKKTYVCSGQTCLTMRPAPASQEKILCRCSLDSWGQDSHFCFALVFPHDPEPLYVFSLDTILLRGVAFLASTTF